MLYRPWGETRFSTGTTPTTWRFTGQREDATIGLYYFNARYLDPVLGRFTQPDTIVPEPGNPQALNRYSYVLNRPTVLVDPTGHSACALPHPGIAAGCWVIEKIALYGPQIINLIQQLTIAAPQVPAAVDLASQAGQASQPASSNTGNTANPGGLDPNDPCFKELARQAAEQAESASCPNCGTRDPQLLRDRGAIAARQHVELAHVGEDGISAWCTNCTSTAGKFWGRSMTEVQTFAKEIGLDPRKAVVYTPQFGGPGHWSLFRRF